MKSIQNNCILFRHRRSIILQSAKSHKCIANNFNLLGPLSRTRYADSCIKHNFRKSHYLNMKIEGFTRFFIICICLSGMYIEYANGATGKYECSSPTSKSVCLPSNYSRYELPNPAGINPLQVEILIEEVLNIDDEHSSITFWCYLNINWPDKRIVLKDDFGEEYLKRLPPNTNKTMNRDIIVAMPVDMTKDLWLPKVMIYNMKYITK